MSPKIAEMKEDELLAQWANQAQVDFKVLNKIKSFAVRTTGILRGSGEFYVDSQEFMSLEEVRSYLKYIIQIKELISTGNELLDNLEKLQRLYKMRSKNQRSTGG